MLKAFVAALVLVCFCNAVEAKNAFSVAGPGLATCKQFGQQSAQNKQVEAFYFAWGQGWMSATNLLLTVRAGNSSATNLAAVSIDEQMLHISAYCDENPFKYYEAAVIDLYNSLRTSQGLPSWIANFKQQ